MAAKVAAKTFTTQDTTLCWSIVNKAKSFSFTLGCDAHKNGAFLASNHDKIDSRTDSNTEKTCLKMNCNLFPNL